MSDDEKPKYNTFRDLRTVVPTSTTSPPSISRTPRPTSRTSTAKAAIAPERNFTRVPNSVADSAVPARLFRGKSKQVYDYLWRVSRGSVVPSRTVRKSRKEIQKGAGLGSMVTTDAALDHLQTVGLIKKRASVGSLAGNEYEVFTYEEAPPSSTSISRTTSPGQNLVELGEPESSSTRGTQVFDFQRTSELPKTSIKTSAQNSDDEAAPHSSTSPSTPDHAAFLGLFELFSRASTEITGKSPSVVDRDRWSDLAELLITELKIAAGRTTVSSVPAFLAEHLRRRLWKKDKKQIAEEGKAEIPQSAIRVDASKCPDCFGTGVKYVNPQTFEGGVVRCTHEALRDSAPE